MGSGGGRAAASGIRVPPAVRPAPVAAARAAPPTTRPAVTSKNNTSFLKMHFHCSIV